MCIRDRTFTITVKEAPHGLDAQYNYDETPAKEVTVYVTISNDGVPIKGRDGTVLPGYVDADNHHIDAVRYAVNRIWMRRGA